MPIPKSKVGRVKRRQLAGKRLRSLRERNKFSTREVALILDMSKRRYESVEAGRGVGLLLSQGLKVAVLFRVDENWLAGHLYPSAA